MCVWAAAAGIIIIRLTLTDKKSSCCCCRLQAVCTSSCLSFCFRFPVMTKTGRRQADRGGYQNFRLICRHYYCRLNRKNERLSIWLPRLYGEGSSPTLYKRGTVIRQTDRGKERLESWSNSEQGKGKTIQQQQCSTRTKVEQQQQQSEKKVQTSKQVQKSKSRPRRHQAIAVD